MHKRYLIVGLLSILILTGCADRADGNMSSDRTRERDRSEKKEKVIDEEPIEQSAEETSNVEDVFVQKLDPKEAEAAFIKIDEAMSGYIWAVLSDRGYDELQHKGDHIKVELSDSEKIRASAFSADEDGLIDDCFVVKDSGVVIDRSVEYAPYGEGYHGISLSMKSIEQNCLDLFGTKADLSDLQAIPQDVFCDIVRYADTAGKYPIMLYNDAESEIDQKNQACRISEADNGYIGEVDMYWGYWGFLANDPDRITHTVRYYLVPDERSKYGMIIASIDILMVANPYSETDDDRTSNDTPAENEPFYGIWCYASKDMQEAQKYADNLSDSGFNGMVFISSEWSNLNAERWYVVSAGIYATDADAEHALGEVKKAGFTNAYVKYSGDHIGG